MPKKRTSSRFPKHTSPVHPSLSSSPSASKGHNNPRSLHSAPSTTGNLVNDLIQRQRLSSASSTPKVTEPSSLARGLIQAQTLPPSLDAILQGPRTLFPDPGLNYYPMSSRTAGRGPAGPPPPSSWLQEGNRPPRKEVKGSSAKDELFVRRELNGYPPINPLPGLNAPDEGSLEFQTMKSLATRWEWHLEHDRDRLTSLPMRTRQRLLHFMAKYFHGTMTRGGLEVLFWSDGGLEDFTATGNLTHLDLGTSIDSDCSLEDLMDIFVIKKSPHDSASNQEHSNLITIPDAWDAPEAVSSIHHQLPSFSFLTHLSLAYPVIACWKSLLRLAPHLTTLTHLSLAYWPAPSFRAVKNPNEPRSPFHLQDKLRGNGGYEAPKILRRLSRMTYCLKWLDLTGCHSWLWALQCADGPDWAGSWRGVQMVKAGQDELPDLAIQSGVDYYVDCWKPKQGDIQGSVGRSQWLEISRWVWYVQSLHKLEGLVNRLRMVSPTAEGVVWLADSTVYDGQTVMSIGLPNRDLTTTMNWTTDRSVAQDGMWWYNLNDRSSLGAGLELRSEEWRGSDSRGRVAFESSPNERLLLTELIEALRSRGEALAPVEFLI